MSIKLAAGINIASALVFFLAGKYDQRTGNWSGKTKEDSPGDLEPTSTPSVYLPKTLYAVSCSD